MQCKIATYTNSLARSLYLPSGTAQLKICLQSVDSLRTRTGVFLCGVCYNLSIQDIAELIGNFSPAEILEQNLLAWTEFWAKNAIALFECCPPLECAANLRAESVSKTLTASFQDENLAYPSTGTLNIILIFQYSPFSPGSTVQLFNSLNMKGD